MGSSASLWEALEEFAILFLVSGCMEKFLSLATCVSTFQGMPSIRLSENLRKRNVFTSLAAD